jgi:hypothetical protein
MNKILRYQVATIMNVDLGVDLYPGGSRSRTPRTVRAVDEATGMYIYYYVVIPVRAVDEATSIYTKSKSWVFRGLISIVMLIYSHPPHQWIVIVTPVATLGWICTGLAFAQSRDSESSRRSYNILLLWYEELGKVGVVMFVVVPVRAVDLRGRKLHIHTFRKLLVRRNWSLGWSWRTWLAGPFSSISYVEATKSWLAGPKQYEATKNLSMVEFRSWLALAGSKEIIILTQFDVSSVRTSVLSKNQNFEVLSF